MPPKKPVEVVADEEDDEYATKEGKSSKLWNSVGLVNNSWRNLDQRARKGRDPTQIETLAAQREPFQSFFYFEMLTKRFSKDGGVSTEDTVRDGGEDEAEEDPDFKPS